MSVNKVNSDGSLSRIAGRGTVEYGASTVRTGTVTIPVLASDTAADFNITFSSPMPDTDYLVNVEPPSPRFAYSIDNKSARGFRLRFDNVENSATSVSFVARWTAFKLHSVEGLEELENDVAELQSKHDIF